MRHSAAFELTIIVTQCCLIFFSFWNKIPARFGTERSRHPPVLQVSAPELRPRIRIGDVGWLKVIGWIGQTYLLLLSTSFARVFCYGIIDLVGEEGALPILAHGAMWIAFFVRQTWRNQMNIIQSGRLPVGEHCAIINV